MGLILSTTKTLTGAYDATFYDEIVADKTTGLSALDDRIIQIAALKIRNKSIGSDKGESGDFFYRFVNPGRNIPPEITELTGISDDMVKDVADISVILPQFLEFIKGKLVVAHNASFDMSFIRKAAKDLGLEVQNPVLDTFALSRFLNPSLSSHKLNLLVKHYNSRGANLGDFRHHFGEYDAEITAAILIQMFNQLEGLGINNFTELEKEMRGSVLPKQLHASHMVILAANKTGLKNLYRLISSSYLNHFSRTPKIPRSELEEYREGLIFGSACTKGEVMSAILEGKSDDELEDIISFYDYLEIMPISNNRYLYDGVSEENDEKLRNLNRRIVALGEKYGKPVCATCDAHFLNREDEIYRKIISAVKNKAEERDSELYFRTTEEMLEEFSYLGA